MEPNDKPPLPLARIAISVVALVAGVALLLVLMVGMPDPVATPSAGPSSPEVVVTARPLSPWPATPTPAPTPAPTTGSASPVPTPTPTPEPVLLVAAGDIGRCDSTADDDTGALAAALPGIVATLGDTAYDSGTRQQLAECFGGSWGRVKDRIRFAVTGNHDVMTDKGLPLQEYLGAAAVRDGKTYFSEDVGAWHVVVLDTDCDTVGGGCRSDSPEATWLKADLEASDARCTVALYHHPRFSSGYHGSTGSIKALWRILYEGGVDLVLNGHDHDYERFAPQDADGNLDDATGITEIVAGTGGGKLRSFGRPIANSLVRSSDSYGVLQVSLEADGWSFRFVDTTDRFSDEGTGTCH